MEPFYLNDQDLGLDIHKGNSAQSYQHKEVNYLLSDFCVYYELSNSIDLVKLVQGSNMIMSEKHLSHS